MPLWLGYPPAMCFAISREALLQPRGVGGAEPPSAYYGRALAACNVGERGGAARSQAVGRLWKYMLVGGGGRAGIE